MNVDAKGSSQRRVPSALAMALGGPAAAAGLMFIFAKARPLLVSINKGGLFYYFFGAALLTAIAMAATGVHRLLWQGRALGVATWVKTLVTVLATLIWLGVFVLVLDALFPVFRVRATP